MSRFRVALSADFQRDDGSPAYPMFDLSALDHPDIECLYLPHGDHVDAADMGDVDALVLLQPRFDRESVPANGRLAMVARFGVGYDSVDVNACTDGNIALVITPDGVRRPVAVSILTLMLALTGRLIDKGRIGRAGATGWAQRADYMGQGLEGLTFGSIGFGNIGQEAFRLAAPLGMRFVASDPVANAQVAQELGVELMDVDDVFRQSDVLSLSCFLNDETRGLADARRLALMKSTAYLINTARGPVVDQSALTEALSNRTIAGAGLDVLEQEPPDDNDPILALDNVIITPHALCWTDQCFAGNGAADIRAVLSVMRGEAPVGIVNGEIADAGGWQAKLAAYASSYGT